MQKCKILEFSFGWVGIDGQILRVLFTTNAGYSESRKLLEETFPASCACEPGLLIAHGQALWELAMALWACRGPCDRFSKQMQLDEQPAVSSHELEVRKLEHAHLNSKAVQMHLRWIQRLKLTNCFLAPEAWTFLAYCLCLACPDIERQQKCQVRPMLYSRLILRPAPNHIQHLHEFSM